MKLSIYKGLPIVYSKWLLDAINKLRGLNYKQRSTKQGLYVGLFAVINNDMSGEEQMRSTKHEWRHACDLFHLGVFKFNKLYKKELTQRGYWDNILEVRAREEEENKTVYSNPKNDPRVYKKL